MWLFISFETRDLLPGLLQPRMATAEDREVIAPHLSNATRSQQGCITESGSRFPQSKAGPGLAFPGHPGKVPPVHRKRLIDQLNDYLLRHPEEERTVAAFLGFVASEPGCFERALAAGHITGSAWVVNGDGSEILLTHHRKLDRWLQLGGHADGDPDVLSVAMKEAEEESGLRGFTMIGQGIFDIDIHPIPARKGEPEHLHYDVRYVLRANGCTEYTVSDESHDLRWVKPEEVETLTTEPSMMRMVAKWLELRSAAFQAAF